MTIEIKMCSVCKATNAQTLIPRIKALLPDAIINDACHSVCGPGRSMSFVIIDNRQILAPDEDTLIKKLEQWKIDEGIND